MICRFYAEILSYVFALGLGSAALAPARSGPMVSGLGGWRPGFQLVQAPFQLADPFGQVITSTSIGLIQIVANQVEHVGRNREASFCGPILDPPHKFWCCKNTQLGSRHRAIIECLLWRY